MVSEPAQLMSGIEHARQSLAQSAARADSFRAQFGRPPCLATVLVGDDPASATYVRMKQNRCRAAGIDSRHVPLSGQSTTDEVVKAIAALSDDSDIDGILVQHPFPAQVDGRAAFEAITSEKDVDGVTMHSFGAMSFDLGGFVSCTPGGVLRLLDAYGVEPAGKHAVVVGRSPILGKPTGMLLLGRHATVTYCHSRTPDVARFTRSADIVVAAVGIPGFVRGDWIKPGAVVVDAGYNEGNVGDVAFDEVVEHAGLVTPVPGGVGPMTVAVLLEQTVDAAYRRTGDPGGRVSD
jgi:methylenetetrahydrofolate dehydrogenase (NADP+)/methenyltetrahydrofolate cyclohydrolase